MKIPALLALLLLMTASCTDDASRPTVSSGGDRGESLSRRAWKMRGDGQPIDTVIAVQEKAVEELRAGSSPDNPVEVLEQMGFFYNIAGDFSQALTYYREATDSLQNMSLSERNDGAIQLFGDLSSLYAFLGMYDQAIEYSDSAVAESQRQNGAMLSDVYRFRAGVYELFNNPAKAIESYDHALFAVNNGPTRNDKDLLRALILGEKAHLLISAYSADRDSVDKAVEILERVVGYDEIDTTDRIYALGLGYIRQGRLDKGLPLLRESAESYMEQEDIERINVANRALLQAYADHGMCDEVSKLLPSFVDYNDSLINYRHANAVAGAMVEYDLKSAEDRNRILSLRLQVENEKRIIYYGMAVIVILVLACSSVMLYMRARILDQKRRLQEKELNRLTESKEQLDNRVSILQQDLNAGMNSNSSILSEPKLITGPDEGRFRRAFNVLHPEFIHALKEDYPRITPNDELLCMLLRLRHTTEEISVYLGISKASVNSARYRLRTKFALPKDVDLDEFIASRAD